MGTVARDVAVEVRRSTAASGLGLLTGVRSDTSTLILNRGTVTVNGGAGVGLTSNTSTITITNSNITATGIAVNSDDTTNTGGPYVTKIDNSTLSGDNSGARAQTNVNMFIGGSHVSGVIEHFGSATTTCVFTYKANYTAYNALCQ